MKTMPMLTVYKVVKGNGLVVQKRLVKNTKGAIIKVDTWIDKCRIETLKSDVITIGVFLLTMKMMRVAIVITHAQSEVEPMIRNSLDV